MQRKELIYKEGFQEQLLFVLRDNEKFEDVMKYWNVKLRKNAYNFFDVSQISDVQNGKMDIYIIFDILCDSLVFKKNLKSNKTFRYIEVTSKLHISEI